MNDDEKLVLELSLVDAKRVRNGLYEYAATVYDEHNYIEPGSPEYERMNARHRAIYQTINRVEAQLMKQGVKL